MVFGVLSKCLIPIPFNSEIIPESIPIPDPESCITGINSKAHTSLTDFTLTILAAFRQCIKYHNKSGVEQYPQRDTTGF